MKQAIIGLLAGVLTIFIFGHVYASGAFEAKSWRDVNVDKYNKIIKDAYLSKSVWVTKPALYIHYLLGMDETKSVLYSIEANTMESPTEYIIKLKREGLLDDSVRGDLNLIVLSNTHKGYWQVISAKRANSCWKDKNKNFYSKPC